MTTLNFKDTKDSTISSNNEIPWKKNHKKENND